MALFKISKGKVSNLPKTYNEGYCYVTTDEHKMYIDLSDNASGRICLNAAVADKLKETVDITVNLASSTPASFDGSADITPGVTGILPTKNGGTGSNWNYQGYTNLLGQGNLTNADSDLKRGLYTYSPKTGNNAPNESGYGAVYNFIANFNRSEGVALGGTTSGSWLWQIGFDTSQVTPYVRNSINANAFSEWVRLASLADVDARMGDFLPRSAGEEKKLTGPLGLTKDVMYGTVLPTSGFDGQLFFLEDDGASLPTGGAANYVLAKNSTTDGDASWKSPQITWVAGTTNGPKPKIFNIDGTAIPAASASASGVVITGDQTFAGKKTFNGDIVGYGKIYSRNSSQLGVEIGTDTEGGNITIYAPTGNAGSTNYWQMDAYNGDLRWYRVKTDGTTTTGPHIKSSNLGIYGAVWNDYAEYRNQKETIEPGYCVASSNNGQVYKTTEKFQACDGIVSDTFGFAIGETDECQTPLAVAGRVLAYFHGNREDYNAGDTVCAGPEGKVMKMTREEIREYPDRIIGIVSEIPEYETWGSGNVAVNNRIWIKIK